MSKSKLTNTISSVIDYVTDSKFSSLRENMKKKRDKLSFMEIHSFLDDKLKNILFRLLKSYDLDFNYNIRLVFADSNGVAYYYTDINLKKSFSKKETILFNKFKLSKEQCFNLYSQGKGVHNISFIANDLKNIPTDGKWKNISNNFTSKYTGSTVSYSVTEILTYTITELSDSPSYDDSIDNNDYRGIEVYSGKIQINWKTIPSNLKFNTLCVGSGGGAGGGGNSKYASDSEIEQNGGCGGGGGGGVVWYPESNYTSPIYFQDGYTIIDAYTPESNTNEVTRSYVLTSYDNTGKEICQIFSQPGLDGSSDGKGAYGGGVGFYGNTGSMITSFGGSGGRYTKGVATSGGSSQIMSVDIPYNNGPIYVGAGGGGFDTSITISEYGTGGCGYGGRTNMSSSPLPNSYNLPEGSLYGNGASYGPPSLGIISLSWSDSLTSQIEYPDLTVYDNYNLYLFSYTMNGYNIYKFYINDENKDIYGKLTTSFNKNVSGGIIVVGGGGAGGTGKHEYSGGGGAGGETYIGQNVSFSSGKNYSLIVGNGGNVNGQKDGYYSQFDVYYASGGKAGVDATTSGSGKGGVGTNGGSGGGGSTKTPTAGTDGQYANYTTEYGEILQVGGGGGGGKNNGGDGYGAGYGGNNGIGGSYGDPKVYTAYGGKGLGYGAGGGGGPGREDGDDVSKKGGNGCSGFVIIYIKQ